MLEGPLEVSRLEPGKTGAGRDEMGHREALAVAFDLVPDRFGLTDQRPVARRDPGPAADRGDRGTRERGGLFGEPFAGRAQLSRVTADERRSHDRRLGGRFGAGRVPRLAKAGEVAVESLHRLDRGGKIGEPQPARLLERPRSERSDPDWRMGVLNGARHEPHHPVLVLPAHRLPRPCRHHGVERALEAIPLLLRRHVEGIEETRPVSPPHPQDHPPRGQPIEHCHLLGKLYRMADGEEVRAGPDAKAPGACGHRGERKQRLRKRHALVEMELGEPERFEAERFRPLRLARELVRGAGRSHVPRRHPDVKPIPFRHAHVCAPARRRDTITRTDRPVGPGSAAALYTRIMTPLAPPQTARAAWIAPSLLSADFARLGDEVAAVVRAGADLVHFDVMDNHFVPNLTFGPMVCRALVGAAGPAPIDVHLMARPVDRLIRDFAEAGATWISIHPEGTDHLDRSLALIRDAGCKAGLVLSPATPLGSLDWTLARLDFVLVMSVNPGFGGQSFIPGTLEKLRAVRALLDRHEAAGGPPVRLQVDGGVKTGNIGAIAAAGADTFVAGSAVFGSDDYAGTIAALRAKAEEAPRDAAGVGNGPDTGIRAGTRTGTPAASATGA